MLFRTVYGAELDPIYQFIHRSSIPISKSDIYECFIPQSEDNSNGSPQNVNDALSFLVSAKLIDEVDGGYSSTKVGDYPFRLQLLQNLYAISKKTISGLDENDYLYFYILDYLFIKPNKLFEINLHNAINRLPDVITVNGLSREKIQSWKRVMTYLGIGYRISSGFQCVYSPSLLREIIESWDREEGSLQDFIENHVSNFLPIHTNRGDLSSAATESLLYLANNEEIRLETRQDSPTKPYFGRLGYRFISRIGVNK